MGKNKNKPKFGKKNNVSNKSKKLNPFELHINKKKLEVVGQRNRNDRGKPGVARAKGIKIVSMSSLFNFIYLMEQK